MSNVKARLAAIGLSSALILAGGTLVAPYEGLRGDAYKDVVGVWTQCYGNTKNVDRSRIKSDAECTDELAVELLAHNKEMKQYVSVPLTDYQEAAFTSFVYNVGVGNWKSSTALKYLNNKKYTEACQQLLRWDKAGGKQLKGLTKRRNSEMEVCLGNNKQAIEEARRIYDVYKQSKNYQSLDVQQGE